jgi:type IV pilus assembly protein PilC
MAFLRLPRAAPATDDPVTEELPAQRGLGDLDGLTAADATGPAAPRRQLFRKKVAAKDLMNFSRQLSAFVRSGIPILDALELLHEDASNSTLRQTLGEMSESLRRGEALSEALDRHPHVFPLGYRSMLRSAELTGNLDTVLDRLAHYLDRDIEAKGKIRSALLYPGVIAAMSIGVTTLLIVFVLPKFKVFFSSFGRELPLPTRMLLGLSDFLSTWYWALLIGAVVVVAAAVAALRNERVRGNVDRWLLRVPALGPTLRFAMVERFARILAAMLQAGVTLPEAMDVASAGTNNRYVRRTLANARDAMMRGEGIADPLAASQLFPPAATQMLRVGERTGYLDAQLEAVATFYERELDYRIKKLTSLFEPAVLIFMGVIVGFVALALVSAMYGIYRTGTP